MQTEIIYGILIPFIGTTAGAACVFFLRRQPHFLFSGASPDSRRGS